MAFAALFLELMLIRWAPAAIRLVAYYANLMLISSFLGLGLIMGIVGDEERMEAATISDTVNVASSKNAFTMGVIGVSICCTPNI